mgnify:CR=1 FL=1
MKEMKEMNEVVTVEETATVAVPKFTEALEKYYSSVKNGVVDSNIGYLKTVMEKKKAEISSTVYAGSKDDQLSMIKTERAAVNKFKDAVTKSKQNVKADLLKPFAEYEKLANETIKLATDTYNDLNARAGVIEEERREEKRKKIREEYDAICKESEMDDFVDELYKLIYDSSWENSSKTMKSIKETLRGKISTYTTGMATLNMMDCDQDVKEQAVDMFKRDLDITPAIQYISKEVKKQAEMEARKQAAIEAERVRMEKEKQEAIEAERIRMEKEKQAAIEAERIQMEAKKQEAIEAERIRVEKEKQAAIEAERIQMEAKKQEAIEAERIRMEKEKQAAIEAKKVQVAQEKQTVAETLAKKPMGQPIILGTPNGGKRENKRILVEFLSGDDWLTVKEYCDLNGIFYSEK